MPFRATHQTHVVYWVYMLRCTDDSLYTGVTTDVARRYKEHANGTGGAYTRSHAPMALVYTEQVGKKGDALRRECEMKKLKKQEKEALIQRLDISVL